MPESNLNHSLNNLNSELSSEQPTEKAKAVAEDLRTQIEPILAQPNTVEPTHYKSLGERLNLALVDLDVDHPRLSAAIQTVLDELASVGI